MRTRLLQGVQEQKPIAFGGRIGSNTTTCSVCSAAKVPDSKTTEEVLRVDTAELEEFCEKVNQLKSLLASQTTQVEKPNKDMEAFVQANEKERAESESRQRSVLDDYEDQA